MSLDDTALLNWYCRMRDSADYRAPSHPPAAHHSIRTLIYGELY